TVPVAGGEGRGSWRFLTGAFRTRRSSQEYRASQEWPVSWSRDYRLCSELQMQDLLTLFTEQMPEAVALLEEMVSMESPSYDKELTDRFVRFLAGKFQEIGGEVDIVQAAKVGNHLRVKFSDASTHRVLLLGHTDTVWTVGEVAK